MTDYVWEPIAPPEARDVFARFPHPWWIVGGWAIDLHLRRRTRHHEDLDIAILRGDEIALPSLLPGWEIAIAHDGAFIPWDGLAPLEMPYHQFWVRRDPGGPWTFEVLLEDHDGAGSWCYRRDARVTLPVDRFGRISPEGIPFSAPEVALLYKAKGHEIEKNAADFETALPSLDGAACGWLRSALEIAHEGHPWIQRT